MKYLLVLLTAALITSCQNDDGPDCPSPPCEPVDYYQSWLEPIANPVQSNLTGSPRLTGPFPFFPDKYMYSFGCFNPNNPYEIAYLREDMEAPFGGCRREIHVFNFRTGVTHKVAENPCYSLDWSVDDWLIYTGVDRQIWKVKSNGDSLTQLTNRPGFNNYPLWSPSGRKFVYEGLILDAEGNDLGKFQEPVQVLAWLNETTVLGSHREVIKGLVSYNVTNHECKSLLPGISVDFSSFFNPEAMQAFKVELFPNNDMAFLRYDMNTDQVDTLRASYISHEYGEGRYNPKTERALVRLIRKEWKDSVLNEIYIRRHLVMLDKDGNELGVVKIPE